MVGAIACCGQRRSRDVRTVRVLRARGRQQSRLKAAGLRVNADLQGRTVWRHCRPDAAGRRLLEQAVQRLGLSARGYDRVLKVARTIGDLADADVVSAEQVGEALQYRVNDDARDVDRI